MEKQFILGQIEFITKGTIEIIETTKEGIKCHTLKIAKDLQEKIENNQDIKKGLTVAASFDEKHEVCNISYLKATYK